MADSTPIPQDAQSVRRGITQTRVIGGYLYFDGLYQDMWVSSIDTRSLDVSMNVICDRNTMVQTTETVGFELRAHIVGNNATVLVWSNYTTDVLSLGGFTLPRKVFQINSHLISHVTLEQIGGAPNTHEFTFSNNASSKIEFSPFVPPYCQSAVPITIQASYKVSDVSVDVSVPEIDVSIGTPVSYDGNIVIEDQNVDWYVASQSYLLESDIPYVAYDRASNKVVIANGALYQGQSYIIVKNKQSQLTHALSIELNTACTPVIAELPPPKTLVSSMTQSMDFFYALTQTAPNTGSETKIRAGGTKGLTWTITEYPGLSISRWGSVRFERGGAINREVTVRATNAAGGTSESVRFYMIVQQTPILTKVADISRTRTSLTTPYRFLVPDVGLNADAKNVLNWRVDVLPPSPYISINPTSGQLTVAPNVFIENNLKVTATNEAGGSDSHAFNVLLAQRPNIAVPDVLSNLDVDYTGVYRYTLNQSAAAVGSEYWRLVSVAPDMFRSRVAVASNGILTATLTRGYVDADIGVSVSNIIRDENGMDSKTFHLFAAQAPVVSAPASVIASLSNGVDFIQGGISNIAPGAGNISWRLNESVSVGPLTIDSTSGTLSLPYTCNQYYYGMTNVIARNQFGVSNVVNVMFDIQHKPVFDTASPLFTTINGERNLVGTMEPLVDYTFDASRLLILNQGVRAAGLEWSFTTSVSTVATIDRNTGVLRVPYNNRVALPITLKVVTSAGGEDYITFILNVVQATKIFNPGKIVQTNTSTSNFTYQLRQAAIGTGGFTWAITSPSSAVSLVNSDTGLVQVARDNYVNTDVEARTISTVSNDIRSVVFNMHVAQKPILGAWNLIVDYMFGDVDYTFDASVYLGAIGTGTLKWQITPYPNLSIDQQGLITFRHHNSIASYVTVTVTNPTGGSASHTFYMAVQQKEDLVDLTDFKWSMGFKSSLRLPLDTTKLAENAESWAISPAIPSNTGNFNSTTGMITIYYDNWIDETFEVTTTKKDGSMASNVFRLSVAQTPVFAFNTPAIKVAMNQGVSSNLNMATYRKSLQSGEGPLTWSLTPRKTGMNIGADGIITFDGNIRYFESPITVTATNIGDGQSSPSTTFIVAHNPVLSPPVNNTIVVSTAGDDVYQSFALDVTPSALFTGDLTWTITPVDGNNDLSGVLTVDSLGRIVLAEREYVRDRDVRVRATNPVGSYSEITFPLTIVRAPILTAPQINTPHGANGIYLSINHPSVYIFDMTTVQSQVGTGPLRWTMITDDPAELLSINSISGALSIPPGPLNINVTVRARNSAQDRNPLFGAAFVTFNIRKIYPPVLRQPANIVALHGNAPYQFNVLESVPELAGFLSWTITSAPGLTIVTSSSVVQPNTYSYSDFTFNNAGITSRIGPTLEQLLGFSNYVAQSSWTGNSRFLSLHNSFTGNQHWTVPETGTYAVILAGAPGGAWNDVGRAAGFGAVLCGPLSLTQGQLLKIVVGSSPSIRTLSGASSGSVPGCGGGGMSSITDVTTISNPLLVAGGGGGVGHTTLFSAGQSATVFNTTTTPSIGGIDTVGGIGSKVGGSGYSAKPNDVISAFNSSEGLFGSTNNVADDFGGFGGGGPGGQIPSTRGGGGGGWIGGNGSTISEGGGGGGSSYCLASYNNRISMTPVSGNSVINFGNNGIGFDKTRILAGLCWIFKVVPRDTKFTITFTNCGVRGLNGPQWSNMVTEYRNTPDIWDYLYKDVWMARQGVQAWVVPNTGTYRITVAGASGQDITHSNSFTNLGGRGGIITASYNLNIGDVLIMTVGQNTPPVQYSSTGVFAGGGGGFSSVQLNGMYSSLMTTAGTSTPVPLLLGGGGPGAPGGTSVATNALDCSTIPVTGIVSGSESGEGGGSGGSLYLNTGRVGAFQDLFYLYGGFFGGGFPGGGRQSLGASAPAGAGSGWNGGTIGAITDTSTSTTVTGGTSYYFSTNSLYVANSITCTNGTYSSQGYITIQQL
jgi:hypothetical protein